MTAYLRTDHWVDAIESLEVAQEFASRTTLNDAFWKWLLISLHSAVQGVMVLALEQGNSLLVMKEEIASRWLEAHRAGTAYPAERMDFFLSLYEKVKGDEVCRYVGSKKFVPGASHDQSMKTINELRNNFIHFFPKAWSIERAGLPQVCLDCLDVIDFLGWESMTIIWHDGQLSERGKRATAVLRSTLKTVDALYRQ